MAYVYVKQPEKPFTAIQVKFRSKSTKVSRVLSKNQHVRIAGLRAHGKARQMQSCRLTHRFS